MTTTRTRRRRASISSLIEANNITLTKTPANRAGIKVFRSSETSVGSDLWAIDLPEGITEEEANTIRDSYGLGDEYEMLQEGGRYRMRRRGEERPGDVVPVTLLNGAQALVSNRSFARSDIQASAAAEGAAESSEESIADDCKIEKTTYPVLAGLRFARSEFPDAQAVQEWLGAHDIDAPNQSVSQHEAEFVFTRVEAGDKEADSFDATLAPGVTGTLVRGDAADVPRTVYRSVVDKAYGNWGWGHLDFLASIADPEYTDKSWMAISTLSDVLENVVLYSGLALSERKVLMRNALDSYADYMGRMMDALPSGGASGSGEGVARSDAPVTQEGTNMATTEGEDAKLRARNDVITAVKAFAGESPTAEAFAKAFITALEGDAEVARGDGAGDGAAPVEAAAAPGTEAEAADPAEGKPAAAGEEGGVTRSAAPKGEATPAAAAPAVQDAVAALLEDIKGTMLELKNRSDTAEATLAELRKKVEEQSDVLLVTRSDDDEGSAPRKEGSVKTSVFTGVFGNPLA